MRESGRSAPKCELDRPFHRVSGRPAWDCDYCGHHLHPTAGTIFHKSSTSLQLWFYAMFLVSQTRCGISAKQLEREIGVTYKTAWRMLNKIRNQLMDEQDGEPLSGEVEVDETAMGGEPRASLGHMTRQEAVKWAKETKTTVVGMVERGGRVRATLAENREHRPVRSHRPSARPAGVDRLHRRVGWLSQARSALRGSSTHPPRREGLRRRRRAHKHD